MNKAFTGAPDLFGLERIELKALRELAKVFARLRDKQHLSIARAPPVWRPAVKLLVNLAKANNHKQLERTMKNLPFYEIENPFLKKPLDRLVEYLNSIDRTLNEDAQFGVTNTQLEFQRQQVVAAFHQQMKVEGERIKAEDAESTYWYTEVIDPYGVSGNRLPKSCSCIGRQYFVRSNKRNIWVFEHDVPKATLSRLKNREALKDDDDIGF